MNKKGFTDGMYDSSRCGFCHDFGEKVKPFICVNCWEKIDQLIKVAIKEDRKKRFKNKNDVIGL